MILGYLLPLRVQAQFKRREIKCNPRVSATPESTGSVQATGREIKCNPRVSATPENKGSVNATENKVKPSGICYP